MEKNYKYIRIIEVSSKPKTKVFSVVNKSSGHEIGVVMWYAPWRQYCFFPSDFTVFSSGCLLDIANFISIIRKEHLSG